MPEEMENDTEARKMMSDPAFLQALLVFVSMGLALLAKRG